jgi:hypothetical protein
VIPALLFSGVLVDKTPRAQPGPPPAPGGSGDTTAGLDPRLAKLIWSGSRVLTTCA